MKSLYKGALDLPARPIIFALLIMLSNAWSANAKEVAVAMGNFEPYFIADNNSGIFGDIITATFNKIPGYEPRFFYGFTNKDLWATFQSGQMDAAANVFDDIVIDGCRSKPVFRFRDVVVSKAEAAIDLQSLADLKGKTVVMFEGAEAFFGEAFASNLTAAKVELGKPELQVRMLHADRYQLSVGDLFIFLQAIKNLHDPAVTPEKFVFHDVLPVTYSRMAFKDEILCFKFNKALQALKDSGEYEAIYNKYLKQLGY